MQHKTVGILGGTFDPIHLGHLRMGIELYETLGLSNVRIIPCYQPVHRELPLASPEHRLEMVKRAIANEPALIADNREIKRGGKSYMIDTLLSLRKDMPQSSLCLFLGADAFLGFTEWHRWQEILDQTHIIVAHRPNYPLPEKGAIASLLKERMQTNYSYIHENLYGGILFCPISQLEISATDIRRQIVLGRNPRYLLPDAVYDYIKENQIYSNG